MARSIGTGNISFGLVSIPVKLYPTTDHSKSIRFNMLDPSDNTRVKQQYVNPTTGEVVERKDMVKGYEFSKGQYVLFDDEELKAVEAPKTDGIEITEFVPADGRTPAVVRVVANPSRIEGARQALAPPSAGPASAGRAPLTGKSRHPCSSCARSTSTELKLL